MEAVTSFDDLKPGQMVFIPFRPKRPINPGELPFAKSKREWRTLRLMRRARRRHAAWLQRATRSKRPVHNVRTYRITQVTASTLTID